MKSPRILVYPCALLVAGAAALGQPTQPVPKPDPQPVAVPFSHFKGHKLPMVQRSVLQGIEGRLDHMAFDLKSGRLYVACRAAGSIEALDASGMKTAQSIKGVPEPMGMAIAPDQRRLMVSCGDGSVRVFQIDDVGQLTEERKVEFRGEADPIRYDADAKRAYIGFGRYFSWFDPATGEKGPEIELSNRPEAMVLEQGGPRVFVSIARKGEIAVIDRNTGKLAATWTLKDTTGNHALAADHANSRLFVACRTFPTLIVLDMKDGREITRLDIPGDADDAWYDAPGKRVYVSCGGDGGKVAMIQQEGPDTYKLEHQESTNAGASTSLLVAEKRKLIVASPKVGPDGYTFLYIYVLPP